MHTMNGHINHMFQEIIQKVRVWRSDCTWQRRVRNFKTELSDWKRDAQEAQPITDKDKALKNGNKAPWKGDARSQQVVQA